MKDDQIKKEILHILESGVNEIRLLELVKRVSQENSINFYQYCQNKYAIFSYEESKKQYQLFIELEQ